MLPSSSPVPPRALTSSVTLTVTDGVDNEEGVTESEGDDSEAQESGEDESDNDCEVDTLAQVYQYRVDNTCMPYTDNQVGEAFCTPVLDTFMASYNTTICKTASAALRLFAITGKMPRWEN